MKKGGTFLLLTITMCFITFVIGLLVGRGNSSNSLSIAVRNAPTIESTTTADTQGDTIDRTIVQTTAAAPEPTQEETEAFSVSNKLNINTATLSQLDALPGIGPVIAQRIIDYRQNSGPFTDVEQLILVKGIGEKKLEGMIDFITVEE